MVYNKKFSYEKQTNRHLSRISQIHTERHTRAVLGDMVAKFIQNNEGISIINLEFSAVDRGITDDNYYLTFIAGANLLYSLPEEQEPPEPSKKETCAFCGREKHTTWNGNDVCAACDSRIIRGEMCTNCGARGFTGSNLFATRLRAGVFCGDCITKIEDKEGKD